MLPQLKVALAAPSAAASRIPQGGGRCGESVFPDGAALLTVLSYAILRHLVVFSACTTPSVALPGSPRIGEDAPEPLQIDWLHQVMVETGVTSALPVGVLAIPGERDEVYTSESVISVPQLSRDLVTVHDGQANIKEDDGRLK